ncbi:hypothetical protein [Aeromonas veronii]|uniref:hypothetical protein n=1 Tax=Aeromonas veronii TaxID=654 RepID=UPI00119FB5CC|nr:hypothetical protein [Aeromonas veronii]
MFNPNITKNHGYTDMKQLWLLITSAPSEAWLGLLGVISGSLLTTLGVALTNRSNRAHLKMQLEHDERLQSKALSKERLEELYVLVCHWQHSMFSHHLKLRLVMSGDSSYNQYLDKIISEKTDDVDFNRLEMIIGIYGGQVKKSYEMALIIRGKINEIHTMHKSAYLRNEDGHIFIHPFDTLQQEFIKAVDKLKGEIVKVARSL